MAPKSWYVEMSTIYIQWQINKKFQMELKLIEITNTFAIINTSNEMKVYRIHIKEHQKLSQNYL